MSRKLIISNKAQIKLLVNTMAQNPAVARGRHFGPAKPGHDDFWLKLSNKLNSLGPPRRIRQDWQRVWTNYKANLRRKANLPEDVHLTALEQSVAGLLNVKTNVCIPRGTRETYIMSSAYDEGANVEEAADDSFDSEIIDIEPAAPVQLNKRSRPGSVTPSTSISSSAHQEDVATRAPQNIVPPTTTTMYSDMDETFCNYLKAEINSITNEIIKDELKESITLALFDAKKKQRRFSKDTSTTATFSKSDQNLNINETIKSEISFE